MYMDSLVSPLTWAGIGTAILCGALVGFERQLRGKPAGMRTSILICFGTMVFVSLGAHVSGGPADPTRVVGQVVTGIGFLGAGVILTREGVVMGVTSASVIWVLAAIGATIGFGHNVPAIFLAILTVAVLNGVELLEGSFRRLRKGVHARGRRLDRDNG
jgi:putative Mg2+ transporter-C (MgtC) family protein